MIRWKTDRKSWVTKSLINMKNLPIGASEANKIVRLIDEAKHNIVRNFLVIGKCLSLLSENRGWKYSGNHIETFDDFLKEIRLGRTTAYNCMKIYRIFGGVLESKMSDKLDIDYTRLIRLLPVVSDNNAEEWLHKAYSLPTGEFEQAVAESKRGSPCQHEELEDWKRCANCGRFLKQ